MNNKYKIFFIVLIICVLILAVVYFVFFKKNTNTEESKIYKAVPVIKDNINIEEKNIYETDGNNDNNTNKDKKILGINDIDIAKIINNKIYYYSKQNKIIGRINIDTQKKEILINQVGNITDIKFSDFGNYLLYKNLDDISYNIYDFENKKNKQLNKNIESAIWYSEEDNKIITFYSSGKSINNINIYNWKEERNEELINLFANTGYIFNVSTNKKYLTYLRFENWSIKNEENYPEENLLDEGTFTTFFTLFDLENRNKITEQLDINNGKFNSDGEKLLISRMSSSIFPRLSVLNINELKEKIINLSTYYNKTAFANNSNILFYAKIEEFDNPNTRDTLWKINIETGEKTQLTELEANVNYDISNIMTSQDDKYIYFINKYDKKLYQVNTE